jgi:hypothetical protein
MPTVPYRFAIEDENFADLSAGRVLYSQPGAPAFPVRLVSEIFRRAQEIIASNSPLTIFDPTCGGAYHLTALGFLHSGSIAAMIASDADPSALSLAQRNLSLLSEVGLTQREQEIRAMLAAYGKASHAEALESLLRLREMRAGRADIPTHLFRANVFDHRALGENLGETRVDLVISDIPYGNLSGWQIPCSAWESTSSPVWEMLESLRAALLPGAVVCIAADKAQKIAHEHYQRVERFQIGKRQVSLLRLLPG